MTDIVNPIDPPVVPPVPQRNDEETFEDRSDAGWEFAFNTLPGYMQDTMDNAHQNAVATNERALAADQRATDAETAKGLAEDARDKAEEWAEGVEPAPGSKSAKGWAQTAGEAEDSAWAAAAAAGASAGLPQPLVPGKVLGATGPGSVGWVDSFRVGDLMYSLHPAGEGWLPVNSNYLQLAYPILFDLVGTQPSIPVGREWTSRPLSDQIGVEHILSSTSGLVLIFGYDSPNSRYLYSKSVDFGATFAAGKNPPSNSAPQSSAVFEDDGTILIAFTSSLYRSTDSGDTWSEVSLPASPGSAFKLVKLEDESLLILTTTSVYRSFDKGVTWSKTVTSGFSSSFLVEASPGVLLASTSATVLGIYRPLLTSSDYGATWQSVVKPSENFYTSRLTFSESGSIFAVNSDNAGGDARRLYRASTIGSAWELILELPDSITYVCYALGSLIVFRNSPDSGPPDIFVSRNEGDSWGQVALSRPSQGVRTSSAIIPGGIIVGGVSGWTYRSMESFDYDTDTMFHVPAGPIDDSGNFNTLIKAG